MRTVAFREALNEALSEEMEKDDRIFLMGEEVGHYDGAYKVSKGLLKKFGENRVIDTPIAEGGFVGVGIGAAMVGLRPVVEMMTFNFALLALDQIVNSAAKMNYMSGGQFNVPIVIRGPGGPAHQLAAQHSQSMEVYFYHVPGLKVVRPTTPMDAKGLLKSSIRDDNPVIFIESETLYNVKGEVEGHHLDDRAQPDHRRADPDTREPGLGDRRVDDAAGPEFLEEPLRHLVGALVETDLLADDEHAIVARHLLAQGEVERFPIGHHRHLSAP